jgi:hypothetical protein
MVSHQARQQWHNADDALPGPGDSRTLPPSALTEFLSTA